MKIKTGLTGFAAMLMAGCSAEPQAPAPEGLEISLTASFSQENGCTIQRVVRYDQTVRPLYMITGAGEYSLEDGQVRSIPMQIQFRSEQGIVTDGGVILTDLPVTCDQVSIEWSIEECRATDRSVVQCPAVALMGEQAFAEVKVLFAY